MRRRRALLAIAISVSTGLPAAASAQSASQVIRLEVRPISRLAVVGTTSFTIQATKAAKPSVALARATYAITTNEENRRITVALDEPMPPGVTLRMRMTPPSGAAAVAEVELSVEPQTAVTGISRLNEAELDIEFAIETRARAVIPATTTRLVKVTLVSGA